MDDLKHTELVERIAKELIESKYFFISTSEPQRTELSTDFEHLRNVEMFIGCKLAIEHHSSFFWQFRIGICSR